MKRFALPIVLISAALLSQACARNTLRIRELASDVARARCACRAQPVSREIRIEKTIAPAESQPGFAPIKSPVGKGPENLAWKVGK